VFLLEEHLLLRAIDRSPVTHPSLERPHLPGLELAGCFSWSISIKVLASRTRLVSATSSGTISDAHTAANASGRVRQSRSFFVADGAVPPATSARYGPTCPPSLRRFLSLVFHEPLPQQTT